MVPQGAKMHAPSHPQPLDPTCVWQPLARGDASKARRQPLACLLAEQQIRSPSRSQNVSCSKDNPPSSFLRTMPSRTVAQTQKSSKSPRETQLVLRNRLRSTSLVRPAIVTRLLLHPSKFTMIRLITAGACALFLIGCTAEATDNGGATLPAAASNDATVTTAKFELGKNI